MADKAAPVAQADKVAQAVLEDKAEIWVTLVLTTVATMVKEVMAELADKADRADKAEKVRME